jgi:hypothetical protein
VCGGGGVSLGPQTVNTAAPGAAISFNHQNKTQYVKKQLHKTPPPLTKGISTEWYLSNMELILLKTRLKIHKRLKIMKTGVFWKVTLGILTEICGYFEESCYLHLASTSSIFDGEC